MNRKKFLRSFAAIILAAALTAAFPASYAQAADSSSKAGIVSVSWGSLNVRSTASASSSILTTLPKGSYVTLMEKSGSWWRVEFGPSKYGYVSAAYIQTVSGTYTASVSSAYLNVRSGAGSSYSVQGYLKNGDTVVVLSGGSWSRILYNGTKVGYVSSKYLSAGSASAMTWPVPASRSINQYFVAGSHLGIDVGASSRGVSGDSIAAACAGTVVYSGWLSGYGYVIYINSVCNGKYIQTRYAHLSSLLVSEGDTVYAGQKIGLMGSTGTSSGVHLHFEVRIRSASTECLANSASTAVDPMNYLN